MGLLGDYLTRNSRREAEEKSNQLEAYKYVLTAKDDEVKPEAKQYALDQMMKTAGMKGPGKDLFTGLLGGLIKRKKDGAAKQEAPPSFEGPGVPGGQTGFSRVQATGADGLPETRVKPEMSAGEAPSTGMFYSTGEQQEMLRQRQEQADQHALDVKRQGIELTDKLTDAHSEAIYQQSIQTIDRMKDILPPERIHDMISAAIDARFNMKTQRTPATPAAEMKPHQVTMQDDSIVSAHESADGSLVAFNGKPIDTSKIKGVDLPSKPEHNETEEELTAKALKGDKDAQAILDAMQKRKLGIAAAGKAIPTAEEAGKEKSIETTARALASGDMTRIQDVTSMRSEDRLRVFSRVKELNPKYDTSTVNRQINMESLYTTGKMGESLQSFGTFLEHAGEVSNVVQAVRLSGSPAVNKPINWWRKNMSGDPNYRALMVSLEPVRKEYESFLLGGHAMYGDDRKAVETLLNDDSSPAQIQAALKQMGKTAKDRYTEANYRYKRVRNKDIDNPFSDEAIAGARKIGIDLGVGGESGGQQGGDMITVQLPDGTKGPIHSSQKDNFLRDHPGSKVVVAK